MTPAVTLASAPGFGPADVAPQPSETWGPFLLVALVIVAVVAAGIVVLRIRRGRADHGLEPTPENRLSEGDDETYG